MSVKRTRRSFSLYDSQRKGRRGGSGFSKFLASIGHAARPILRGVEKGLVGWGKQKLAKKIGERAVNFGSNLLKDLEEGKSIKSAAQSPEGRALLRQGWDGIKGRLGAGSVAVPSDINRALTLENQEALQNALQPQPRRQRRRRRSRKKSVAKKTAVPKKRAGSSKRKGGSNKRAGSAKRKKAGSAKRKKAGSAKRKKAGSAKRKKAGSKRAGAAKGKKKAGSKPRKKSVHFKKSGGKKKSVAKKSGGGRAVKSILKKKSGGLKSIFD